MLLSMTGHGAAHRQQAGIAVAIEIRTVNSRFYKLSLRTSEGYSGLEAQIDEYVRQQVRRGTVQIDLYVRRQPAAGDYRLNQVVLGSYWQQLQAVMREFPLQGEVKLESLLILPGVVEEPGGRTVDAEALWPLVEETLAAALQGLGQMRASEGRAMAADLGENCRLIGQELEQIEAKAPLVAEGYRNRLTERINKLLGELDVTVDPSDLIREVGLFAERSDIAEEVVRLRSHLDQFLEVMQLRESAGRKLEFVSQEMLREANTIGSKANNAEIARHVIEIKTALERIREMIQNVE